VSGEFFAFYAQVPEAGFEIIQYRDPDSVSENQWIVSKDGHVEEGSAGVPDKRYQPLEDFTALFRTFADTISTEKGILEFANKYGLLNGRLIPPPNFREDGVTANFVLDAIASGIPPEGGQHDFLQTAAWMLQFPINKRLREETNVTLVYSHEEGRQRMYILPKNLIGAMWLQFAQAVDGNTTFRRCAHCGTWFEISPNSGFRTNRAYCTDPCKSKAYRKRKEALRLHDEGIPVGKIASKLDADIKTIEGWLKRSASKRSSKARS
jgi:hypothetical protein